MTCLAHQLAATRNMLVAEDVDLLRELTALLPTDRDVLVADFGSGSGTTALAIFAERQKNIRVISVDINLELLGYCSTVVEQIGCTPFHTIFAGDTSKPDFRQKKWRDLNAPIDLLLIDTSHELEATRLELDIWLPKLVAGGYLWMHDYEKSPYDVAPPGVKIATNEAVSKGVVNKYKQIGCSWSGVKL